MKNHFAPRHALILAGLLFASLALVPESGGASLPALQTAPAASPAFLAAGAATVVLPVTLAPALRGGGPGLSVLPTEQVVCSASPEPTEGFAICSAESGSEVEKRCSATCDSASICSASADFGGTAICSALGDTVQSCSIFVQGGRSNAGPASCSAFAMQVEGVGGGSLCSVDGPGQAQACSVRTARTGASPRFQNFCSAMSSNGPNQTPECSVLGGFGPGRRGCSVFLNGQPGKTCSVFETQSSGFASCSVYIDFKDNVPVGRCTNLNFAAVNSCSVHSELPSTTGIRSLCSVINSGEQGTRCGFETPEPETSR